jgi:DNA-binding response OmpR family regulator
LGFKVGWSETEVVSAKFGEVGLKLVETISPDAVILDLGLPDISGFDVLESIRLFSIVPVIVLTVNNEEKYIIKALELGADDYMVKPFRQLELIARIKAIIRARHPETKQTAIIGPFQFDTSGRRVIYAGKDIDLTSIEYIILRYLLLNRGVAITHKQLAQQIWGCSFPEFTKTVRVHVSNLRKKLESNPSNPKIIITKPNIGYMVPKDLA